MLFFKNNIGKDIFILSYTTGINTKNKKYFINFNIKFIDHFLNGENIYFSRDELDEDIFMFRFDIESEWKEVELYKSYSTIEEIYGYMGFLIDVINICIDEYNKNDDIHHSKEYI